LPCKLAKQSIYFKINILPSFIIQVFAAHQEKQMKEKQNINQGNNDDAVDSLGFDLDAILGTNQEQNETEGAQPPLPQMVVAIPSDDMSTIADDTIGETTRSGDVEAKPMFVDAYIVPNYVTPRTSSTFSNTPVPTT
jgi:hypothetical protein